LIQLASIFKSQRLTYLAAAGFVLKPFTESKRSLVKIVIVQLDKLCALGYSSIERL